LARDERQARDDEQEDEEVLQPEGHEDERATQ
jgi:hypothetical protein